MTLSDLSIGLTNVPILLDLAGAEPTLAVPAAATAPEDEEEAGTMVWGGQHGVPMGRNRIFWRTTLPTNGLVQGKFHRTSMVSTIKFKGFPPY